MNAIVPEVNVIRHTPRTSVISSTQNTHTVRKGQSLSSIIRDHLKRTGQNHSASSIYKGVNAVAQSNQLSNPDHIRIGQRIDLSALAPANPAVTAVATPVQVSETKPADTSPINSEPFHRVLNGTARLSSPFGVRTDPIAHEHREHNGIDLAATRNTPITPMRPGVVTFSGWMRGYGNTVIVQHDGGLTTQYSHAAKRLVEKGTRVDASTIVGLVGSTGRATGPHLHLEVRRDGQRVNPLPYLMTEPVHTSKTRVSLSI